MRPRLNHLHRAPRVLIGVESVSNRTYERSQLAAENDKIDSPDVTEFQFREFPIQGVEPGRGLKCEDSCTRMILSTKRLVGLKNDRDGRERRR